MCSPMVVKMERPNPTQRSTKSPEKCLMPICKVWGKTEELCHDTCSPVVGGSFGFSFTLAGGPFLPG